MAPGPVVEVGGGEDAARDGDAGAGVEVVSAMALRRDGTL